MFNLKDGKLSLNKERQLTPRQLATLSKLPERTKLAYLATLLGISRERVFLGRTGRYSDTELSRRRNQPGRVLRMLADLSSTSRSHVPNENDLGDWIGVEIECFLPIDSDLNPDNDWDAYTTAVNNAKRDFRMALERAHVKRCQVKHDGSLSADHGAAIEITVLINSKYGYGDLEKLCKVLREHGAFVNRTCGLHVHFDARAMGKVGAKKFGKSIGFALPILSQMVPASRRNNSYCRLGVSQFRGDRYYAVNLTAYEKFKTVEIRLHSGTTDFSKIRNWIELLKLVGTAQLTRTVDLQGLIDVGLPEPLIEYVERRTSECSGNRRDREDRNNVPGDRDGDAA